MSPDCDNEYVCESRLQEEMVDTKQIPFQCFLGGLRPVCGMHAHLTSRTKCGTFLSGDVYDHFNGEQSARRFV